MVGRLDGRPAGWPAGRPHGRPASWPAGQLLIAAAIHPANYFLLTEDHPANYLFFLAQVRLVELELQVETATGADHTIALGTLEEMLHSLLVLKEQPESCFKC